MTIHRHTANASKSRTYRIWSRMRDRCRDASRRNYKWYGGRGIKVCERWESFSNFLADMGEAPASLTIDRIDANGHYEPDNCRWASMLEQNRNRRDNRTLTHDGQTKCISEWAERTGINARAIWKRLNRGWPVDRALTEPLK